MSTAKRARKRRIRSPHPGVVLIPPNPANRHPHWRARIEDPDTGTSPKVTLDAVAYPTETRRDWAIRKSRALAKRRVELEGGAHRTTGTALSKALDKYFEDNPQIRAGTKGIYRRAADKLSAWGAKAGVRSADDLTGPKVVAFRAHLVREPLRTPAKGGKRGELREGDETRAAPTVNAELRAIRTVLGYLRKLGLLPRVTSDDLKDGLERLAVNHERTHYLKPVELQRLLEAALRHDAEMFAATREEHAGEREPGTTARYEPIAPLIACALLTGMRAGEVIDLDWKQVDLEALDNDGETVGEIHLTSATKTKRARTIGLEVSPALRLLLAAMHLKRSKGSVLQLTRDTAKAAAKRLKEEYGAPAAFGWQALRRTCGTYLTNAPGIFGAASAYRSAKQLGHSVQVAERHYLDVARGIPREARTLEAAMQIEAQLKKVTEAAKNRSPVTLDVKRNAS
ncbi:MAG TPA: tyrosine-type recombinase/integrase [Polyangiaceae bacterium]|nr:tyrosine-type recombinase/integrase [Polyangiaceae bacterium]